MQAAVPALDDGNSTGSETASFSSKWDIELKSKLSYSQEKVALDRRFS